MKTTCKWMFAAILLCGLTVSSCNKDPQPTATPDPEPTTQTVRAGMVGTGVSFYDSVTYSYEYDAEYRIVRSEAHATNQDYVIRDLVFTYSDGHISVIGTDDNCPVNIVCDLDDEGRITHFERTSILPDSTTIITNVNYTYDAEGHLASEFILSNDSESGTTSNYIWEGDELKTCSSESGIITIDYEASDVPAQAQFSNMSYDIELAVLCTQGCFGKLPAHMPAKRTLTTGIPIPGMPLFIETTNYTYTIDAEGRLATSTEIREGYEDSAFYIYNWEER